MDEQNNNNEETQPMPSGQPINVDETQPMPTGQPAQTGETQSTPNGQPVPVQQTQQYVPANKPSATGALVCGILAILFCGVPIAGIVLGIIAIVLAGKYYKAGGTDGQGKAGRICGIIGIILSGLMIVVTCILLIVGLQALDEADVDDLVYESIVTSSSSAVDTSRQSEFTAEEQELIDLVDVQMQKLKNQDPDTVATVARIIEESLNDELEDIDVTFAQLGISSTDIAKSMLQGFDYTPAFASVYGDEGSVSYDVTVKDISMVGSAFTANVYNLMDDLEAVTSTADGYRLIGQALIDAVNETDPSTDGYMSVELVQGPSGWTIDAESWNDNLEYLFEF